MSCKEITKHYERSTIKKKAAKVKNLYGDKESMRSCTSNENRATKIQALVLIDLRQSALVVAKIVVAATLIP